MTPAEVVQSLEKEEMMLRLSSIGCGVLGLAMVASVSEASWLVPDPGFETQPLVVTPPDANSATNNAAVAAGAGVSWMGYLGGGASSPFLTTDPSEVRTGNQAMALPATTAGGYKYLGFEGRITGLTPSTSYTIHMYAKGGSGRLVVNDHGSSQVGTNFAGAADWTLVSRTFTTGATNTTADVGFYKDNAGTGGTDQSALFVDDVELVPEPATLGLASLAGIALMRRRRS